VIIPARLSEFIKPIILNLDDNIKISNGIAAVLLERVTDLIIVTGQHYDKNMSDVFVDERHIPKPCYFLDVNGLSHGAMTGQMLVKIETVLINESPDYVLVYGDTNSTLAGSLAASKLHIPVVHVESGLRSFNRKMPEEINRVMTDHVSSYLFCPTKQAIINLRLEGIVDNKIHKVINTGDVMFDATLFYKKNMKKPDVDISDDFILSTLHRAENTDDPERLQSIFDAFVKISKEKQVIAPIHPRTKNIIKTQGVKICYDRIKLIDPVSYYEMLYLLEQCDLVMTDSGGLQKEAYFFNTPCITLRDETEWVELVEKGYNCISGAKKEKIYDAYIKMKDYVISDFGLYGNGNAGMKIVKKLIENES